MVGSKGLIWRRVVPVVSVDGALSSLDSAFGKSPRGDDRGITSSSVPRHACCVGVVARRVQFEICLGQIAVFNLAVTKITRDSVGDGGRRSTFILVVTGNQRHVVGWSLEERIDVLLPENASVQGRLESDNNASARCPCVLSFLDRFRVGCRYRQIL